MYIISFLIHNNSMYGVASLLLVSVIVTSTMKLSMAKPSPTSSTLIFSNLLIFYSPNLLVSIGGCYRIMLLLIELMSLRHGYSTRKWTVLTFLLTLLI